MIKWIRWQGLIGFVVVVGTLMALWLLFVDGIVKSLIEKTGMAIVGAEVNVKADVNLFPLGVMLEELQITNPEAPETNSFECSRIAFNLDTLNLLRSKVIINEMAVEGMRFDTKRKRPGRVSKKAEVEKRTGEEKKTLFALPVQIPDIKTILQNENLESVKLIETTKADLQKKKADWQQRIDQMPNKAKLDSYRARIATLKKLPKGDVLGMAGQLGEARAVRRDLEQDIERVKQTRTAFKTDLANTKTIVERAQQAPMNDVRRLRDKYSISAAGLANMSELLFGDQISSWIRTGLLWRSRIQPVVERAKAQKKDAAVVKPVRGKGMDVRFKEYRPLPDFLIDRTAVSAETAAGILAGTIRNITPDQNILRLPLTFAFTGEKLQAAKSIAITGALNHINPLKQEDRAKFSMRGFKVQNFILSEHKELPIALQEAFIDFDVDGSFTQALRANFRANINSARMNIGGDGSKNPFVSAVRSALSKVNNFSISADMAGTLENYKMNITSDLDRVLKGAVSSVVQEQGAKLEQQLKTAIQERTGGQLKELQESFGGLNQQGTALTNVQNQLNTLLQEAVKSAGGKGLKLR
jgi:uncharacterized protein (TIGR03545 family)